MPNRAIEFHDSTLERITNDGECIVIRLAPAYVYHSEGTPGRDPGEGWVQDAQLYVRAGTLSGDLSGMPCDLWGGDLYLNDEAFDLLPVPFDRQGAIVLDLECMSAGERIHIEGTALRVEMSGEAEYVEQTR
jgi:hypothetical protein